MRYATATAGSFFVRDATYTADGLFVQEASATADGFSLRDATATGFLALGQRPASGSEPDWSLATVGRGTGSDEPSHGAEQTGPLPGTTPPAQTTQ